MNQKQEIKKYLEFVFGRGLGEIIYGQAVHETGNFSSKIYRENNNLFGMKLARIRPKTAIGERYGHAVYKDWRDSVYDLKLWLMYNNFNFKKYYTVNEYVSFLRQKGYFEDSFENYVSGVSRGMKYV